MKRWEKVLQANYATPTIEFVSGKGCVLLDEDGREYLDFLGGIATSALGHAHPALVKAVTKQMAILGHVSNLYAHPNALELAEKLQKLTGDSKAKVFFCNSGAEANEAALKLSRKTGKRKIVATHGSFHGRTMGALSLTGQPGKRDPFKPLLPGIKHVPFGNIKKMKRAVTKRTAMVIVEPIMGEAGVIVPPQGYLKDLRVLCDRKGVLLVFDCVQTGMGRTGKWFGYEHEGVKPDVITLAKGLAGGLPIGAMIALGEASNLFKSGDHGSTFGGNPVTTAAALATINAIEKEELMTSAKGYEVVLKRQITQFHGVKEVRGTGLLIGIELIEERAKEVVSLLQLRGVLANAANPTTIRIAPALIVNGRQIDHFIAALKGSLEEVFHG